jgi:uncharacterized protein YciI
MPYYAITLLVTGPPEEAEPLAEEYRGQLAALRAQGKLRAAGELGGGDGFLVILDAKDRMEAEQIARSGALVENGLGTWMLREWTEL